MSCNARLVAALFYPVGNLSGTIVTFIPVTAWPVLDVLAHLNC
jgi:hypothetical protein